MRISDDTTESHEVLSLQATDDCCGTFWYHVLERLMAGDGGLIVSLSRGQICNDRRMQELEKRRETAAEVRAALAEARRTLQLLEPVARRRTAAEAASVRTSGPASTAGPRRDTPTQSLHGLGSGVGFRGRVRVRAYGNRTPCRARGFPGVAFRAADRGPRDGAESNDERAYLAGRAGHPGGSVWQAGGRRGAADRHLQRRAGSGSPPSSRQRSRHHRRGWSCCGGDASRW